MGFLCVLKMYHVSLFIIEKIEFGTTPKQCRIHSKGNNMPTCAYISSHMQVATHIHKLRATLVVYFQKNIFANLKGFIFHFNTPQVNLNLIGL